MNELMKKLETACRTSGPTVCQAALEESIGALFGSNFHGVVSISSSDGTLNLQDNIQNQLVAESRRGGLTFTHL